MPWTCLPDPQLRETAMKLADIARGAYSRSPSWLRRSAGQVLSLAPASMLMGRQYREWQSIIARTERDPDYAAEFQARRLRTLLARCAARADFYRPQLPAATVISAAPRDDLLRILADLPVLEKETVRAHGAAMMCVPPADADPVSTSGSTSEPLSFYLDRDRSVREWAFVTHIWSRAGFGPRSIRGVLRGVQLPQLGDVPWDWDPALRELRFSPFHLTEDVMDAYLALADRYRVDAIHGYPSSIEVFAGHALRRGWPRREAIRCVLPISEPIFDHQRELVATVFPNARTMPFYGLSEKSMIAGEVPGAPGSYAFEPAYGLAELVAEDGRAIVTPGETGRVVGTGFISAAMPLLRYDSGDLAELEEAPSPRNGYRLRIRRIASHRSQEILLGRQGEPIGMAAINIHSPAYSAIRVFQFMQDSPGTAVLKIAPVAGAPQERIEAFVAEISRKLRDALTLDVEYTDDFTSNSRGKRPYIDQRIPEAQLRPVAAPTDRPERSERD
ncbi:MAG: hypothetical protein RIB84_27810 [Sneathiellaceae bacterium]